MEESTDKYLSFAAVDINALAEKLNAFVTDGGTITTLYFSTDKVGAYALVLGSEPEEEEEE